MDFKTKFILARDAATDARVAQITEQFGEVATMLAGAVHIVHSLAQIGISKIRADIGDDAQQHRGFKGCIDNYSSAMALLSCEAGQRMGASADKTMGAISALKELEAEIERGEKNDSAAMTPEKLEEVKNILRKMAEARE